MNAPSGGGGSRYSDSHCSDTDCSLVTRTSIVSVGIAFYSWSIRVTQLVTSPYKGDTINMSTLLLLATISVSRTVVLTGFVPVGLILLHHPRLLLSYRDTGTSAAIPRSRPREVTFCTLTQTLRRLNPFLHFNLAQPCRNSGCRNSGCRNNDLYPAPSPIHADTHDCGDYSMSTQ